MCVKNVLPSYALIALGYLSRWRRIYQFQPVDFRSLGAGQEKTCAAARTSN